ncbi:MAG: peptidase M13 [Bacteroidetes bacterium CG_4_8_14_3_um_filter_31_14]|nr:MAG: peptidase M13 [Bacteroidetes bacterium CG_4_8_14_3_um_filter_31_14]
MILKTNLLLFSSVVALITACSNESTNNSEVNNMTVKSINPANLDTTVAPGSDFYMYANGNWLKNNPIKEEYSVFGSFHKLDEDNTNMLKELFDNAINSKDAKEGTDIKKIADFYSSGLDTLTIEKLKIEPLVPYFNEISAIKNTKDLINKIAKLHTIQVYPVFYIYGNQDDKNSKMVIGQIMQGGIGLPDRDYYLSNDKQSKILRKEYVKYIVNLLSLSGKYKENEVEKIANNIMKIETQLAKASMTRVEMRDPQKLYHKMNLAELQKLSPDFDWGLYFNLIGKPDIKEINVNQPDFIKEIGKMTNSISINDWKDYLSFHLLNSFAPYLSNDFEKVHFGFYGTILSGKTKMKDRWKRIVEATSGMLGEAVGKIYVEKYFPAESKTRMLELVKNLKATLKEHIQALTWMTPETKVKAVEKLETINLKIGYPDKWRDYSKLIISKQPYVLNVISAENFEFKRKISEIDKPVERAKWDMTPQTVNAYYNPNMNEIVFPAAILQPPFFNKDADDAVNYGGIGAVIGHEMTHGFDDQGCQYDKDGNLKNWWTKQDIENFKKQNAPIVDVYNNYVMLDTLHVNGKLTLGENIADFGGVSISLDALKNKLKGDEKNIDGFTPIQRFYLSFAEIWRQQIRNQELMRRLKEDVHSPARARVNIPVYHSDDFYKAFNVKETDARFVSVDKRIRIW